MFLPDVTNIRSPTTFAPVVSPTSCLMEPRYSTLGDITASGSGGTAAEAGVARHSSDSVARRVARRVLILPAATQRKSGSCADRSHPLWCGYSRHPLRRIASLIVVAVIVVGVLLGGRAWVRGQDYLRLGGGFRPPAGS